MKPAVSLTLEEWETLLDQRGELVFKHGDGSTYIVRKRTDIPEESGSRYVFIRDEGTVRLENVMPTLLSLFLSIIFVYHNDTVDMTVDADTEHIGMLPAAKDELDENGLITEGQYAGYTPFDAMIAHQEEHSWQNEGDMTNG